jgi:hypothetical protein
VAVLELAGATATVPFRYLEPCAQAYAQAFGWQVRWTGRLPVQLAAAWGLSADRRCAIVAAAGAEHGVLRLVEGLAPAPASLQTVGWQALHVAVSNVDHLTRSLRLNDWFAINGGPADIEVRRGSAPTDRGSEVVGPGGVQWSLIQPIRPRLGRKTPRPPADSVSPIEGAVLASRDYRQARSLYQTLGLRTTAEFQVRLATVNRERAVDSTTTYPLTRFEIESLAYLEVDGFPADAARRPHPAGELPAGIGIVTLQVRNLEQVYRRVEVLGYRLMGTGSYPPGAPWHRGRAITLMRAEAELVELLELPD